MLPELEGAGEEEAWRLREKLIANCDGWVGLSRVRWRRQRIAIAVIPERRSLIRDRNALKRRPFGDPGSRFAWPG
jgi:hypothetical protein